MINVDKIKELSSYLLPIDIIATLLDVDEYKLRDAIDDKASEISKAYYLGQAQTVADIRKQEVELAKAGSPLAVQNVGNYILEQKTSENG